MPFSSNKSNTTNSPTDSRLGGSQDAHAVVYKLSLLSLLTATDITEATSEATIEDDRGRSLQHPKCKKVGCKQVKPRSRLGSRVPPSSQLLSTNEDHASLHGRNSLEDMIQLAEEQASTMAAGLNNTDIDALIDM